MPQSPRRLKQQVRDAVGEQIRDIPINAARLAMFGVGRALLLTDRMTRDVKEMRAAGVLPVLDRMREDVQQATGKAAGMAAGKVVSLVAERVGGGEEPAPEPARPQAARPSAPEPRPARRVNTSLAAGPEIAVGKPAPNGQSVRPARTPAPPPAPKPRAQPAAKPAVASEQATKPAPKPAVASEQATKSEPTSAAEATAKIKAATVDAKPPAAKAATDPAAKAATKPEAKAPAKPAAKAATKPKSASSAKPEPVIEPAARSTAKPAATSAGKPNATSAGKVTAASLPVPDYDEASIAALRARLRGLSADQVGRLREYERQNAARADVLRMYENRIAKLEQRG